MTSKYLRTKVEIIDMEENNNKLKDMGCHEKEFGLLNIIENKEINVQNISDSLEFNKIYYRKVKCLKENKLCTNGIDKLEDTSMLNNNLQNEINRIEAEVGKRVLNIKDVAKYIGISIEEVEELISNNEIKTSGKKLVTSHCLANWFIGVSGQSESSPVDNMLTSALSSQQISMEDIDEEEFEMVKKERGLGSVYFNNKRNVWQAAFYIEENGEKKRKIISGKSQMDVITRMGILISGGQAIIPVKKHTMGEIWTEVLEKQLKAKCTTRTLKWYMEQGKHALSGIKDVCIEDLTTNDITRFLNNKGVNPKNGEKYADKTIRERAGIIKKICIYAYNERYTDRNLYNENVVRPRGTSKDSREKALDGETVEKLLIASSQDAIFRPLVYCLLISGMRIGEFLALRWSDLDRKDNCINIVQAVTTNYDEDVDGNLINKRYDFKKPKTTAGVRRLPVHRSFFDVLDQWKLYMCMDERRMKGIKKNNNGDLVFPNNDGKIRSYQSLRKQFERFLNEKGIGDMGITFHCLRKTCSTMMNEAKVRRDVISMYLGHEVENPNVTTQKYIYTTMELKKEASEVYYRHMKELFKIVWDNINY